MYECLAGYTPFYADDPVTTCRKILRWQNFLEVPEGVSRNVSPECIDFMLSLITESSRRIGRNGVEEIKAHPWFRGIDWDNLRAEPAPFLPEGSARMKSLLSELRQVDPSSPAYRSLIQQITANFDNFNDDGGCGSSSGSSGSSGMSGGGSKSSNSGDPGGGIGAGAGGAGGGGGGVGGGGIAKAGGLNNAQFEGYTYKRKKDVVRTTLFEGVCVCTCLSVFVYLLA